MCASVQKPSPKKNMRFVALRLRVHVWDTFSILMLPCTAKSIIFPEKCLRVQQASWCPDNAAAARCPCIYLYFKTTVVRKMFRIIHAMHVILMRIFGGSSWASCGMRSAVYRTDRGDFAGRWRESRGLSPYQAFRAPAAPLVYRVPWVSYVIVPSTRARRIITNGVLRALRVEILGCSKGMLVETRVVCIA